MKNKLYTVRACRWGDSETHSYIVGVYTKKHKAQEAAKTEAEYRGGKYECEILEWNPNEGCEGKEYTPKIIYAPWHSKIAQNVKDETR